ncbi:hypothetical protein P691DRAFT_790947 [Macrolepiota fuliginosa MF-IS2]|uniref:Uncharacterized protein n=1 Tax=Macrolepiota fuliginosa MF-IS2 TaxID=1400762 RepID=A0A9P6BW80_9AGAR|nr:hypothetical protein P691DRAFT_790947 [Macrolepiota fuliginosa MF-IS2]
MYSFAASGILENHYASLAFPQPICIPELPEDSNSLRGTHISKHGWVYDLENGEAKNLNAKRWEWKMKAKTPPKRQREGQRALKSAWRILNSPCFMLSGHVPNERFEKNNNSTSILTTHFFSTYTMGDSGLERAKMRDAAYQDAAKLTGGNKPTCDQELNSLLNSYTHGVLASEFGYEYGSDPPDSLHVKFGVSRAFISFNAALSYIPDHRIENDLSEAVQNLFQ